MTYKKNILQKFSPKGNSKYSYASKGFTLIEMVVVLAIIGILILIAVPSFTHYIDTTEETETNVYAASINTAVIQTLFPYNTQKISKYTDLNNTSSAERQKILRLADLPEGDTIQFLYYGPNNIPKLSTFVYPAGITDKTWIVYIPTNSSTFTTDSIFNFELDVIVFSPKYTTLKKFANSVSVVD